MNLSDMPQEPKSSTRGGSVLLSLASLIALMVSVAALVLIVIVWADKSWVNSRVEESGLSANVAPAGMSGGVQRQQRTYVFGLVDAYPPHSYLNDEGRLVGLWLDHTMAICADQRKQCAAMAVKDLGLCWDAADNIGKGIVEGYFVGCVGWYHTQARDNVFSFSSPIVNLGELTTSVVFKAGAGYTAIGNRSIGILEFTYNDVGCLRRAGQTLQDSQIKLATSEAELKHMLDSGDIDFAFVSNSISPLFADRTPYDELDLHPRCQLSDPGLMTAKSEREMLLWFNQGLQNIRQNGVYQELCRASKERYVSGELHLCL